MSENADTTGEVDERIRDATRDDLPRIVAIYNESIDGRWSTADLEPVTVASREAWFAAHDPERRPLWVLERGGEVIAWVSLTWFYHSRPAYDATAEIATYVSRERRGEGIGLRLKRAMIAACPRLGVDAVISTYFEHNTRTAAINARLGFVEVGHLPAIAVLDGVRRGVKIALLRIPGA